MPQRLQKVCFATPVLNVYVVSFSEEVNRRNCCGGTMACRIPFLVQMEQLQSTTCVTSKSTSTSKRTSPQWQPPVNVFITIAASPSVEGRVALFHGDEHAAAGGRDLHLAVVHL